MRVPSSSSVVEARPVEGLGLVWRSSVLRGLEWVYHAGVVTGSAALFALGGFVPVARGWLYDEIRSWAEAVEVLGGVRLVAPTTDPDADLGPVLDRADAPELFTSIDAVARRLGTRRPGQVRLTYLPCCGAVAWGRRSRALVVGLPLLHVLNLAELRAIVAHELAHLAQGDAARTARSSRFVQALERGLQCANPPRRSLSPLRLWARLCRGGAATLLGPITRGQETRADRRAAALVGGDIAASALVKVAMVQPLFREVLDHYDPTAIDQPNLYAFFRTFWNRLPEVFREALRLQLLTQLDPSADPPDATHPPLAHRLAIVLAYPPGSASNGDLVSAATLLGDLEALEQMLHNRLFGHTEVAPSVFHRAGS